MNKSIRSRLSDVSLEKIYLSVFVIIVLLTGFFLGRIPVLPSQGKDTVSVRQLRSMMKNKKFTLVNVHTPYEGEIEKTDAFVSYDKVVEQSSALPKDKSTPVILYCKSGRMSEEALTTVRSLGYSNVRHLDGGFDAWKKSGGKILDLTKVQDAVLPRDGFTAPVAWGTLGKQLVEAGVINLPEFRKVVPLTPEQEAVLNGTSDKNITITADNAQFVVDVLWALGLAQKSIVYTDGPLGKEYLKDQGGFASTGGWNLAKGPATTYLGKYDFIPLTAEQQMKVGEIAKNVYRPCCGNSTWFPDCNHGMAALALIELLVSADIPEKDIYRYVLGFNSFWFQDSYVTLATYFARQGTAWDTVDPKTMLGEQYSSGRGAGEISKKVGPLPYRQSGGGSCGA